MEGYYLTKNQDIPLNDRKPGEVADVALQQLARWQEIARSWPVRLLVRKKRWLNICDVCRQSLWFEGDKNGVPYQYQDAEILALIVAHIRQAHSEVYDASQ